MISYKQHGKKVRTLEDTVFTKAGETLTIFYYDSTINMYRVIKKDGSYVFVRADNLIADEKNYREFLDIRFVTVVIMLGLIVWELIK